jgi:nucleoside-diphosphate-sugar epimerase
MIEKITDKELKVNYQKFDKADAKDTQANIIKAQKILDYDPEKNLEVAIMEFIEDYKNNNLSKYLV